MGHIYKITNQVNGKSYIGYSDHVESRWNDHKTGKGSKLVYQAIKKYGIEHVTFEILAEDSVASEDMYIQLHNTMQPNGYNLTPGGGLPPNHKGKTYEQIYGKDAAELQKQKRLHTKIANNRLGGVRKHSDDIKKQIRESVIIAHANRDCSHSEDTKNKISQANKGRLAGANNPKAKNWILIDPSGKNHYARGNLRNTCKELGLSYATMHKAYAENRIPNRGSAAGWQIKHDN
jgi:group I intron endonuclease